MIKMKPILFLTIICLIGLGLHGQAQAEGPKTIRFATAVFKPNCAPDLPNQGFHTDLVRTAFKRMGYEIKVEFMPFARAMRSVTAGHYDGILSTFYKPALKDKLAFSDTVVMKKQFFFQKKGASITYKTFEDLKPYSIGVIRGTGGNANDGFEKARQTILKVEEADSHATNIKKLLAGRIDLMLATDSAIYDPEIKKQVEALRKPVNASGIRIAISKSRADADQVVADFHRGLKMIIEDGTYEKILANHGSSAYSINN